MPIRCSVCILTYNSARTLERALESVKDFSDIVVADGGSTDETIPIARRYGARVFPQRENGVTGPINDFTAIRARLFAHARESWRLWLDSDEWLSEEARVAVHDIIARGDTQTLYAFSRKVVIGGRAVDYAYFYPEYCKRLFHCLGDVHMKIGKKVHEDLAAGARARVENVPAVIYHQWSESYPALVAKDNHYLTLTMIGKRNLTFKKRLRIALINFLKATRVFAVSCGIYARRGFRKTLPVPFAWRFIRYHLLYAKKVLFI